MRVILLLVRKSKKIEKIMAGQPAFLLPDYGSGGKKAGCFFIKWFLIANKKEEICVSLSPLYNETWKDTIRVKNKFSKIFSIAVYTSFALSVGACKSDPVRLPELSGHRGACLLYTSPSPRD